MLLKVKQTQYKKSGYLRCFLPPNIVKEDF